MHTTKRITRRALLVSVVGVAFGAACSDVSSPRSSLGDSTIGALSALETRWPTRPHVAAVTVTLDSTRLTSGHTMTAHAVATDRSGTVIIGGTITWSSSATQVATVSSAGIVTAVAPDTAQIRATIGGVTGSATVTVMAAAVPVATVTVSLASATVAAGTTTQATSTATDASGNVLTGRSVAWSSGATTVATVSSSGLVTAVAAGSTPIVATSEGKTGSATVTVTAPAATQLGIVTQPSATAQGGVPFPQQPAIQLRNASGTSVGQEGIAVTAAIATGGGALGGTTTATTNASGTATFINLSISGTDGSRTLSFSAPGLTSATSSPVSVTTASPSPVGASEPVYNAATQTMVLQDAFDSYTSFSDAEAQGWRCTNSSTTQDVSTNPLGACQVIAPGSQGSAHAIRLVYDGIANSSGQEGHSWNYRLSDAVNSLPGHTLYISYDMRITPGGGFTLDDGRHIVQVKWLELWDQTDRAQFNTQYQTCWVNVPQGPPVNGGTIWTFYGNGGG